MNGKHYYFGHAYAVTTPFVAILVRAVHLSALAKKKKNKPIIAFIRSFSTAEQITLDIAWCSIAPIFSHQEVQNTLKDKSL